MNYSIIIPHYNIPCLLDICLESIPKRDDVQVIVVDDCSSDSVKRELKRLEEKFPHVMFIYLRRQTPPGMLEMSAWNMQMATISCLPMQMISFMSASIVSLMSIRMRLVT